MIRRLRKVFLFLALGLVTTIGMALLMALLVDVQLGPQRQADSFDGEEYWTVTRWDRAGAAQILSSRVLGMNLNWSPQQAAGKPDSQIMGDNPRAWASLNTGNPEWLILDYAKAVIPRRVDVYENYTPGALSKVSIFDEQGKEIVAWSGVDPSPQTSPSPAPPPSTPPPVAVSRIPISLKIPTRRIKIYIASDKVKGWNEIDAVGLIDATNTKVDQVQWATHVKASSTYASVSRANPVSQISPESLTPNWSGLNKRSHAIDEGQANSEERRIDARGWPMLALRSESTTLSTTVPAAAANVDLLDLSDSGTALSSTRSDLPRYSGVAAPRGVSRGAFAITTPSPGPQMPVPLQPIWTGLLGDTLFFAAAWFGLWAALVVPRRFIREVARFRRGACMQCGYDLGYEFIHGCPECGWRRNGQTMPATTRSTMPLPINRN